MPSMRKIAQALTADLTVSVGRADRIWGIRRPSNRRCTALAGSPTIGAHRSP